MRIIRMLAYYVCGIVLLLLTNCQSDDPVIHHEHSSLKKGRIQNFYTLKTFVEELKVKSNSSTNAKSTSLESTNGFDILYDQDMYIQEIDNAITYSIPIHKYQQEGKTFSNLIVRFSETEPTNAFIVNYHPNDEYVEAAAINEQTPFSGHISSESIHYDGSLDILKSTVDDCRTIFIKYCDWDEGTHGEVHLGGPNCTPGFYWFEPITICFDDEPSLVDIPSASGGEGAATNNNDHSTAGSNTGSGTTNPPVVIPNVPRTYNNLKIDGLSLEITEWLNNNPSAEAELIEFLEENNWSNEAKEEVRLTLQVESISDPEWDTTRTGMINGHEALRYVAAYDGYDNSAYTMYQLANGHILCESTTRRKINPVDSTTISDQDDAYENFYYVKLKEINGTTDQDDLSLKDRWYHYSLPPVVNNVGCFTCDMNYLISQLTTNTLVFFGRYVIPIEDVLIVITGEDFDGVESSAAVSGTMLVLEVVGISDVYRLLKMVKHTDTAVDAAQAVFRYMDDIFETQRRHIDDVLDGTTILDTGNNIRRGNFGEMVTDVELTSLGFEPLHARIADIDQPLSHGIDGIFRNPETGEYLIVESKYNTSQLSTTLDGQQMSDDWILGTHTGNNRIAQEVGVELADEIMDAGYKRVVSRILPDGSNHYELLDSAGEIVEIWFPTL